MTPWKPWPGVDGGKLSQRLLPLLQEEHADVLLSGAGHPDSRWNVVGLFVQDELRFDEAVDRPVLEKWLNRSSLPVLGLAGYTLGYQGTGKKVRRAPDDPPGLLARRYEAMVRWSVEGDRVEGAFSSHAAARKTQALLSSLESLESPPTFADGVAEPVRPSATKSEYMDGVGRSLAGIARGDYYQLNLTMAFDAHCEAVDLYRWFLAMFAAYPAPYYALFHLPGGQLVSTSPESFLRVRDGVVTSKPIKGTAPRTDAGFEEDVRRLKGSLKEEAELSMIVDLIRNDLSHHCEYGSVRVPEHRNVFEVDGLLQMVSEVTGVLRGDSTVMDLFWDAFPGGSITGTPKQSAMEAIAQLESESRGPYCGSLFLYHGPRGLDANILIRTGLLTPGQCRFRFYAGSGIVIESDAEAEYEETVSKVGKFLRHLP